VCVCVSKRCYVNERAIPHHTSDVSGVTIGPKGENRNLGFKAFLRRAKKIPIRYHHAGHNCIVIISSSIIICNYYPI